MGSLPNFIDQLNWLHSKRGKKKYNSAWMRHRLCVVRTLQGHACHAHQLRVTFKCGSTFTHVLGQLNCLFGC